MKKIILKTAAILLILAGGFVSCGKEKENEPVKIPFTEYSLAETSCQWTNFDYDEKVIVINSNAELEQYVTCTEDNYPEIDFSEQTLLFAKGGSTQNVISINTIFNIYSTLEYELDITVVMGGYAVAQGWHIFILASKKITNYAKVNLKLNYVEFNLNP